MSVTTMRVRKTIEVEVPMLPERIKQACDQSDRRVTEICAEAGISAQYFYDIVRGRMPSIPLETLQRLQSALGVDFGIKFDS